MVYTTSGTTDAVMVVRLRPGVAGETRRVCHVVPVNCTELAPDELTALCGERLRQGDTDVLDGVRGMPCSACLQVAARRGPSAA